MQSGVGFHDYLLRDEAKPERDAFFVFTGALQLSSLFHASNYLLPPKEQLEVGTQCPSAQTVNHWERLDLPEWLVPLFPCGHCHARPGLGRGARPARPLAGRACRAWAYGPLPFGLGLWWFSSLPSGWPASVNPASFLPVAVDLDA